MALMVSATRATPSPQCLVTLNHVAGPAQATDGQHSQAIRHPLSRSAGAGQSRSRLRMVGLAERSVRGRQDQQFYACLGLVTRSWCVAPLGVSSIDHHFDHVPLALLGALLGLAGRGTL